MPNLAFIPTDDVTLKTSLLNLDLSPWEWMNKSINKNCWILWLSFSTDRRKLLYTEGNRAYRIEKFSKKFRFPIPQEFSSGRRPAPAEVNKFIRECVACLQAQEGITLGTETLRMGAQVICTRVPILQDPKPPGFPKDKMFPYWVKYWHFIDLLTYIH